MGAKEVFCTLYWIHHGGEVDQQGKPVFRPGHAARGYCPEPEDCRQCPLMQQELRRHPPDRVYWVCPSCIGDLIQASKDHGISYHAPGHFTEGQCEYPHCSRPERIEDGETLPKGYSRFLQLIIF